MADLALSLSRSNRVYRIAVGCLFFLQGICFASWASRIPSIQQTLHLSDAALGAVLFALPIGSLLGLPLSGWLIARFGSRRVAATTLVFYAALLTAIGFAPSVWLLIPSLVLFGIAGNMANIAINTQAVGVESRYGRSIMASFHGIWSLAGFTAAGIGSFMIARQVVPLHHFLLIAAGMAIALAFVFPHLLAEEPKASGPTQLFYKPDGELLRLGIIAFCCMICEGAMFDWSGIYFQKVVQPGEDWVGAGYTAFMLMMATGRFLADRAVVRLGFHKTLQLSSTLIVSGLLLAVILPSLPFAIGGFLLVGLGVSSVVPLVYSQAGRSKTLSPGHALATVSSIGFLGFLVGPPLIGIIAGAASLRFSFAAIAVFGAAVFILGGRKHPIPKN